MGGVPLKVEPQDYLDLVQAAGKLCTWDIEATGLKGDYNTILVISVKPYGKKPVTFSVDKPGHDKTVALAASDELAKYHVWVTYFGKGFDVKMVNTRLLRWGQPPLVKQLHVDLYYTLKAAILTGRRSQGHLLSWLRLPEEKMTVSADDWAMSASDWDRVKPTMVKRCESDTRGLEALYTRTRHLIKDVTR